MTKLMATFRNFDYVPKNERECLIVNFMLTTCVKICKISVIEWKVCES